VHVSNDVSTQLLWTQDWLWYKPGWAVYGGAAGVSVFAVLVVFITYATRRDCSLKKSGSLPK
jgi:hypothetical protein